MTVRAASIRLLCLDVDGVLTDGTVQLDDLGHETKRSPPVLREQE